MSILGYRIPSDYKNQVSKYTHSWKHPAYFTIHPGLAYVTHHRHVNSGDTIKGSVSQLVQSQPMLGPLMNGFRLITIATFTPDSIFYGWMRNGVRYSPKDWSNFNKFYFYPVDFSESGTPDDYSFSYVDPSTPSRLVEAYTMSAGMRAIYTTPDHAYYNVWNTPYFISSTQQPLVESLKFHDNTFGVVGRCGLADCLGIPPGAVCPLVVDSDDVPYYDVQSFKFDVAPWFAYFLSTYYYIANMQEPYMYYTRGAYSLTCNTDFPWNSPISKLTNLGFHSALCGIEVDAFLETLSNLSSRTALGSGATKAGDVSSLLDTQTYVWMLMGLQAHGGLFSVPYRPDFFNNIIKVGESPSVTVDVTPVDGENGKFQLAIPDLRAATKWQNVMDRVFVGQGRFGDQLRALFGTNSSPYTNKPDLLGVWQASINPTNTVASAAGTNGDESSFPGQMTARLDSYSNYGGKRLNYYAKEPGTVMFISFLVPMPSYSQGLHPDLAVTTFADDWNPELAGSGFTSVPRWRYTMLPSLAPGDGFVNGSGTGSDPNMRVVGDTVAFDWLKTDYPRLHGEFSSGGYFEYWTLNRRYTNFFSDVDSDFSPRVDLSSENYSTYINPYDWQYIFATTTLLDPNFFVGFDFDLDVTSSVPAGYMPYLGR